MMPPPTPVPSVSKTRSCTSRPAPIHFSPSAAAFASFSRKIGVPELLLDIVANREIVELRQVIGADDHAFLDQNKSGNADTDSRQALSRTAFRFQLIDRINDIGDNRLAALVKIGGAGDLLEHLAISS